MLPRKNGADRVRVRVTLSLTRATKASLMMICRRYRQRSEGCCRVPFGLDFGAPRAAPLKQAMRSTIIVQYSSPHQKVYGSKSPSVRVGTAAACRGDAAYLCIFSSALMEPVFLYSLIFAHLAFSSALKRIEPDVFEFSAFLSESRPIRA